MASKFLRKATLLFTMVVLLVAASLVQADDISNNLDDIADADYEIMSLVVGQPSGSVTLRYIVPAKDKDDKNGCNLTGSNKQLTVRVESSDTSVATVSPATVTFPECVAEKIITVTPVSAGSANVTLSFVSVMTGATDIDSTDFNLAPASFTVNVSAPTTNHPPVVEVTGVTHGGVYEFGQVPTPGCSVVDEEDGSPAVSPDLSEISGPLSGIGLGLQTATCTYTDTEGLTTAVSATYTIVDSYAPTANPVVTAGTLGSNGWYTSDVTVDWGWNDSGAGIDPANCTMTSTSSGEGQVHLTAACKDLAGNEGTASFDLLVDQTPPVDVVLTPSGSMGQNGWFIDVVTITTTGSDAVSGIASCTAPQQQAEETAGAVFNGSCTDNAGLSADAAPLTVKLDKTAPTAVLSASGTLGNEGWYTSDVIISTTGSDTISSPVTCTESQSLTTDTAGAAFIGSCTNDAGLSTDAAALTVKRDATPPSITWSDVQDFYFGFPPAVQPTCQESDDLSGPAGCAITGYDPNAAVGPHTLTATAYDVAGNQTVETRTYTVKAWTFSGFYQPVDMTQGSTIVWNTVKNGSTVPLKFELFAGPSELTDTSYIVTPLKAAAVACGSSTADDIELLATGGTTLRYDTTGGQFIYNWQTPKAAGTCYKVTVSGKDGSSISAYFKLK